MSGDIGGQGIADSARRCCQPHPGQASLPFVTKKIV
jgi:hypothetical protein